MGIRNGMSLRYEMRNEIEQIIKDENIDRNYFKEASKFEYEKIIRRFYYTFCDYKKCPDINLNYCWLNIRNDIKKSSLLCCGDWDESILNIDKLIPETSDFYYFILDYGWVYEGRLKEIKNVIINTSGRLEDFFILPKKNKFNWAVCYCEDGDCIITYHK